MNVASLELCKELYEASGWGKNQKKDTTELWMVMSDGSAYILSQGGKFKDFKELIPAYVLGYLLRKLQKTLSAGEYVAVSADNNKQGHWFASISNDHSIGDSSYADTPEDAACLLAIELFKQNILTKEIK